MISEQRSSFYYGHYFGVPRVVVEHRYIFRIYLIYYFIVVVVVAAVFYVAAFKGIENQLIIMSFFATKMSVDYFPSEPIKCTREQV